MLPELEVLNRLKTIREAMKLNKKKFSEKINIEYTHYFRIENGERDIPIRLFLELIRMGYNINWLLTGDGEMMIGEKPERGLVLRDGTESYGKRRNDLDMVVEALRGLEKRKQDAVVKILIGLIDLMKGKDDE